MSARAGSSGPRSWVISVRAASVSIPGRSGIVPAGRVSHDAVLHGVGQRGHRTLGGAEGQHRPAGGAAVGRRDDQSRHHPVDREEGGEHRHPGLADRRPQRRRVRRAGRRDDRDVHHQQRVDVRAGRRYPYGRGQVLRADVHPQVLRPVVGDPQPGVQAGVDRQHAQRTGVADDGHPVTEGDRLGGQQLRDIEGGGEGVGPDHPGLGEQAGHRVLGQRRTSAAPATGSASRAGRISPR